MKQTYSLADFCSMTAESALQKLQSSHEGLTDETARAFLAVYGPNEITKARKKGFFEKLLGYIIEPMVIILMAASVFSFFIKTLRRVCHSRRCSYQHGYQPDTGFQGRTGRRGAEENPLPAVQGGARRQY
jgi:magnesium-transporting ATPase (P-type)